MIKRLVTFTLFGFCVLLDAGKNNKKQPKKSKKELTELTLPSSFSGQVEDERYQTMLNTDLYKSVKDEDLDKIYPLILLGAQAEHPDILHKGVLIGSRQLVVDLIRAGADINKQDWNGETPIHLAIRNNYADIAIELAIRGADLFVEDDNGWTPLSRAAQAKDAEIVRYFAIK